MVGGQQTYHSRAEDMAEPGLLTLEAEVSKESDVFGSLLALGQGSKDEKALPSLTLANADALQSNSQVVQERLSNAPPRHDAPRANVLVNKINNREENASDKDPFGDVKVGRLDLGRPSLEGEQVDSREAVDAIDSA